MINREDIYWIFYCISECLRENNVGVKINVESLFDLIPYGIIKKAANIKNATPVCEWVMENLGYEYDNEKDDWVKS